MTKGTNSPRIAYSKRILTKLSLTSDNKVPRTRISRERSETIYVVVFEDICHLLGETWHTFLLGKSIRKRGSYA